MVTFNLAASDCKGARPGASFNVKKKTSDKVMDKEYNSFLKDLGVKVDEEEAEEKYVPPMGDLSARNVFEQSKAPLMLTNGSCAPGAASAHARAISNGAPIPNQGRGLMTVCPAN